MHAHLLLQRLEELRDLWHILLSFLRFQFSVSRQGRKRTGRRRRRRKVKSHVICNFTWVQRKGRVSLLGTRLRFPVKVGHRAPSWTPRSTVEVDVRYFCN